MVNIRVDGQPHSFQNHRLGGLPLNDALMQQLVASGQQHLLQCWNELTDEARRGFARQLSSVDWPLMRRLKDQNRRSSSTDRKLYHTALPPKHVVRAPRSPEEVLLRETARLRGRDALRSGRVAVLIVAGGDGTRLEFPFPKGMFPIGPVSGKSLFQLLAEKVIATSIRYRVPIPYLVMTSNSTHDATVAWFVEHNYFGLDPVDVHFFRQGALPVIDSQTGKMLLEDKGKLSLSADGHGGVLAALEHAGLFDHLRGRGVEYVFYHQIDNPLVQVCDPVFLGYHVLHGSEASTKVVSKRSVSEKVGVVAEIDERTEIIEYSDLPTELSAARNADGSLQFWAGNTAIHVFNRSFLERAAVNGGLPWHAARKKVPFFSDEGKLVQPAYENGLKFERFIFDALPLANRTLVVEAERFEEFAPLKNSEGESSPAEVRRCLVEIARRWLSAAGVEVPVGVPVEISPFVAMAPGDIKPGRFDHLQFDAPVYLDSPAGGRQSEPVRNSSEQQREVASRRFPR